MAGAKLIRFDYCRIIGLGFIGMTVSVAARSSAMCGASVQTISVESESVAVQMSRARALKFNLLRSLTGGISSLRSVDSVALGRTVTARWLAPMISITFLFILPLWI